MKPGEKDLGPLIGPMLEILGVAGHALMIAGDRGARLEQWYVNRAAAALLGYTVEEFHAIPLLDKIVPEQRGLAAQLTSGFRAGQPLPPVLEFVVTRKDGSRLPVELTMSMVPVPEGLAYLIMIRDVDARQQTQLSLLEADRIGLVGALAAGFAHEINNPLTSVLLNLRSLRKQLAMNLPEAAQATALRCLDDVTMGAERIASSVRALQTLATRTATRTVDLAAMVSSALRLAAPTLEPRAQVLRQIFPVPPVTGEESRIGQAVLAMLLFSSSGFDVEVPAAGNRIIVAVEERGGDVVVEVSDNGRHLSPDEVRAAFDPFFRSPARGAGVGVGLGVARSVATTLGGSVTLTPRDGGGAVITMRLPPTVA